MKAIIHIGTEKTGSTTIQHFLRDSRSFLQSHGVAYPLTPGLVDHRQLAYYAKNVYKQEDAFIREHGLYSPERLAEWKTGFENQLQRELSQLDTSVHSVIFSSEHLHSRLWGESGIQNLKQLLLPWFTEIEILVYLRRQDQVAVSGYSTKLKTGETPGEILNLNVDPKNHYYNYYVLLNKWSAVFGRNNVQVRLFDPTSFHNNDLISDFLAAAGISENQQWFKPRNLNAKLSWQAQKLLLKYNYRYPRFDRAGYNELNDKVREKLLQRLEARYQGREELPARAEAMSFYDLFRFDNRLVAREWFNRDFLFNEDFSVYPADKMRLRLTPVAILYFEIAVKWERYKMLRSFPDNRIAVRAE